MQARTRSWNGGRFDHDSRSLIGLTASLFRHYPQDVRPYTSSRTECLSTIALTLAPSRIAIWTPTRQPFDSQRRVTFREIHKLWVRRGGTSTAAEGLTDASATIVKSQSFRTASCDCKAARVSTSCFNVQDRRPQASWQKPSTATASQRDYRAMISDLAEFVFDHHTHGALVGNATEPAWNGYVLRVACPCGVVFERWVTPEEADADLLRLAELN
jgi:hypothetical protein